MSHPHKAWLALALLAIASPASASDFTGVLALFFGAPLQLFVILLASFIHLRRRPPSSTATGLAIVALLSSVPPFAILALLAHSVLVFSWAPLLLLIVAAAGWIWHNPRSWPAPTLAGLLLVLAVGMGGLMGWDLSRLLGGNDAIIYLIMLMLLGLCACAVWLCIRVIWPARKRAADGGNADRPTETPYWRFNLGSVHQGVLPAVVLLLTAGYGIYTVLSKVRS